MFEIHLGNIFEWKYFNGDNMLYHQGWNTKQFYTNLKKIFDYKETNLLNTTLVIN